MKARLLYNFINANGGWDNWEMIELEKYPCKDSNEAYARERYWKEKIGATLNSQTPLKTVAEKKNCYIECECGLYVLYNKKTTHKKDKCHRVAMEVIEAKRVAYVIDKTRKLLNKLGLH